MTVRSLCALALLLAAPAAFASSGAQSVPDWAAPQAAAPAAPSALNNVAPPNPPAAPAPVPVDGGLALLAIAGAGYATKKLRARRAD